MIEIQSRLCRKCLALVGILSVSLAGCYGYDGEIPIAVLIAPESVAVGETFTLDATESIVPEGAELERYFWTNLDASEITNLPIGTTVATESPELTVSFDPASPIPAGSYDFELVVQDSAGAESDPVTATIIVINTIEPTAVLDTPGTVGAGVEFTLDASRSAAAPPAQVAEYIWTNVDFGASEAPFAPGQSVTTTEPSLTVMPTGTLGVGVFRFELIVVDTDGLSSEPVEAQVTVVNTESPTAVLQAPEQVQAGIGFNLDGSNSVAAPVASIVKYTWRSLDGEFANLPLDTPVETAEPSLFVQVDTAVVGAFTFELVVTDDSGNTSAPARVEVVIAQTQRPTAVITVDEDRVPYGESFELDGSASSAVAPSVIAEYRFRNMDCDGIDGWDVGDDIVSADPILEVLSPIPPGVCAFGLMVMDDSGNVSSPHATRVTIIDFVSPTAVLDGPSAVSSDEGIQLSGSASFDEGGGEISTYVFTNVSLGNAEDFPVGSSIETSRGTLRIVPDFRGFPEGDAQISLEVIDNSGNRSAPDTITIRVGR